MNQVQESKELAVLAYDWPGSQGGYRMSCRSCLQAYLRVFAKVHFICIADRPFGEADQWRNRCVEWHHVPTVTRSHGARFASSLFSPLPAITMRYSRVSRRMMKAVSDVAADCHARCQNLYVVLQAIPMACFLEPIRRAFPGVPIALSSHDLCTRAFSGFAKEGSLLKRTAWKLELAKIKTFEKKACLAADRFWAITENEAEQYAAVLSVKPDGVFYRGIDTERYISVPQGDPRVVVHVGAADLRKGAGLREFIERAWPRVRSCVPDARLVLGGRSTERFADKELGIEGLGFVRDDIDVLTKGMIFLNSQRHGAGLQFKSLIAMVAGKALVTTSMGIEGIDGNNQEHFFVADTPTEMADQIVALMYNGCQAEDTGRRARTLTARRRSQAHAESKTVPLLQDFANLNAH